MLQAVALKRHFPLFSSIVWRFGIYATTIRILCADGMKAGSRKKLVGGLQVCLDLSSAFDKVPWRHIDTALQMAQVPDELRQVLMRWLEASSYDVSIAPRLAASGWRRA